MENCIFCKIINNEIPSYKLYEDDLAIIILDISQSTKGHCLIIPKDHYQNIFEIPKDLSQHLFDLAHKYSSILKDKLNINGLNILNNNNEIAGQTVFHFHIHLIPRYDFNDKIQIKFLENNQDIEEVYNFLK